MPVTKKFPPSRRMHYLKVLSAGGTAYSTVYLHILASAKCSTSVGNENPQRLETDTDSTSATVASLKLPWSLANFAWPSKVGKPALESKIKLPQLLCLMVLAHVWIWVTILQYEGACVRVTSVDVIIISMHNTAQVYLTTRVQRLLLEAIQDRYTSCIGIVYLLNLSCNSHETFDQMSSCVRVWGCDTCMLLSGQFCSFIIGWLHTPCKVMVLHRLHTHVIAWTGRVSCCEGNALWQHALCFD